MKLHVDRYDGSSELSSSTPVSVSSPVTLLTTAATLSSIGTTSTNTSSSSPLSANAIDNTMNKSSYLVHPYEQLLHHLNM